MLQTPEFDWAPETIGVVDSSFFWGYLITQVPGGFLASKYAANKYNTFPWSPSLASFHANDAPFA